MARTLTDFTKLQIVAEAKEDSAGARIRFCSGLHGQIASTDANYVNFLRLLRRSLERRHPVGITIGDANTISEVIRADNDVPLELPGDGRLFFQGHDGVFRLEPDHPEFMRIRALLVNAIEHKEHVWFIAQPDLTIADVAPADRGDANGATTVSHSGHTTKTNDLIVDAKQETRMSKYSSVRTIGRGGFGIVEEVRNATGKSFARKTFSPSPLAPAETHDKLRKRFKREVMIQAELSGAEIMPVVSSDLDAQEPWFVMPLAEMTYDRQIQEDRRSGIVNIDAIADILNGLQYLHDLGYVHRDLNPKNILRHEGHWKLSDLGAVLPPTGRTVTLTEGTVIYTEQYCSPEQRNDFHSAQSSADVYALGCILHDIFGSAPRVPYSQHRAEGEMGLIIEKCTEINPARRPSIKVLRELLLETLAEVGGQCKVEDAQSEVWLKKLDHIEGWVDTDFAEFARFFANLDLDERTPGHQFSWVYSVSTPFLTRLPREALEKIVSRKDGTSAAIVEKYCTWVRSTAFLFHYADTVCSRLVVIFDIGTPSDKAIALTALLQLGESHNRWYVMREMLQRCGADGLSRELARRFAIEIKTEELERQFRRCVQEVRWDVALLAPEIAKLCS